jgi:hypothetical protein
MAILLFLEVHPLQDNSLSDGLKVGLILFKLFQLIS